MIYNYIGYIDMEMIYVIKVEKVDVWGWEHAIRGMRNPLNSWDKSDSKFMYEYISPHSVCVDFNIGNNDLDLMKRLYKAGSEHRKYLRQIMVSMDITAPLYWWKQADVYKVGTVANSCSTMHKIASKEFELEDFSTEHLHKDSLFAFCEVLNVLNGYRNEYLNTKDKDAWWQMIQLLPSSYNQRRTVTMNYENVVTIIKQRTGHKLDEWNEFVKLLQQLPLIDDLMTGDNDEDKT